MLSKWFKTAKKMLLSRRIICATLCKFHLQLQKHEFFLKYSFFSNLIYNENNSAAQAAGADHSPCNSTNRQNPYIQPSCRTYWINDAMLMSFENRNVLSLCNIVYFMTGSTIPNRFELAEQ